ncbi:hypothetical protein [Dokdonella immobilis]|uniref:Uncharacterized protein n=1 Tax=Dokdonella immobilis TaxID=578942 RepID=A0A1I5AHY0_9GAMM|nr:hypothetical protein [Dokdonella immobilis]SFN62045.1 hypothetical protein SAMN05216289_13816 [Dokdonella immobilis]
MDDPIPAWQCIGCGRIEAPQTCIGVCQDRKVFLVPLQDHQEALGQIQQMLGQIDAMQRVLARIAHTTPRAGQWEASYRTIQAEAKALLASLPD